MKIWYDYYNNIGVVIATKRCHYLFHLQVHKIQISQQEQKNRIIYFTGGVDLCTSRHDSRYYCWPLLCHWITSRSLTYYRHITSNRVHCVSAVRYLVTKGKALGTSLVKAMAIVDWFTTDTVPESTDDSPIHCWQSLPMLSWPTVNQSVDRYSLTGKRHSADISTNPQLT